MRLIDAEALKEIYTRNFDYENCIYDGATVVSNIDEAPTVNTEPVDEWLLNHYEVGNEYQNKVIDELVNLYMTERKEECKPSFEKCIIDKCPYFHEYTEIVHGDIHFRIRCEKQNI